MNGDLLVEEEALYDVRDDRGAAHSVEDDALELAGLNALLEVGVELGEVVLMAPEDTLEERVAEHGLETLKTGLHSDLILVLEMDEGRDYRVLNTYLGDIIMKSERLCLIWPR